ncbi:metalloregulator ArsR/SmtB family transcription factor [Microcella flavibacter]|uniref:metalloregulator ArsR/SmtB family transcription factor n=1 Tax=Microcella flavibacter TaxID=1804990 RepID=UPI0014577BA5|nr:metalloregulator ArsR/SmtB family transcription factor [Microcella flavibacter]
MRESVEGEELRLVADPTRSALLRLLLAAPEGRETVGRLAELLQLRQPTVSHHLRLLHDAALVERTPEGRRAFYAVVDARREQLAALIAPAAPTRVSGQLLQRMIGDLADRFAGSFSRETIERYVLESYDLLAERARITRYLPSLTARFAADRLSALVRATEPRPDGAPPEVLFVCVQNAGRSQLASAILRHLAGDRVRVRTAGSAPAEAVRGSVVMALDEIGVPLGGEFPKPLTDEVVRAADVVVTMGCGDACPVYPGRRYLDWAVEDPVGRSATEVAAIRDDIDGRVRALLAELLPATALP